jgi:hypothetical protein
VLLGMAGGLLAGFGVVLLTVNPTAAGHGQPACNGRVAQGVSEHRRDAITVQGDCPDFRREARENGTVPFDQTRDAGAAQTRNAGTPRPRHAAGGNGRGRFASAARKPSVEEALKTLAAGSGRRMDW